MISKSIMPDVPRKILFISLMQAAGAVYLFKRIFDDKGIENRHIIMGKRRFLTVVSTEAGPGDIELLAQEIEAYQPGIIAFSITATDDISTVACITARIRQSSKAFIIAGGLGATVEPDETIKAVDGICIGEGIKPFVEFADAWFSGTEYRYIMNFWYREGSTIIRNALRPLIDINAYPVPSYEGTFSQIYNSLYEELPEPAFAYIVCSLGCPMKCTYCTSPYLSTLQKGTYLRTKSIPKIMEELRYYKSRGLKSELFFFDEIFPWDDAFVAEFCAAYKQQIGLPFRCWSHPSFVKEKNIRLMKDAGLDTIIIGIQSCSERVRKLYGRHETNRHIEEACRIFHECNVKYGFDLILSPLDTWRDHLAYFKLIPKLKGVYSVIIHYYCLLPKTKLREYLLEQHLVPEGFENRNWSTYVHRPYGRYKIFQMLYVMYVFLINPRFILYPHIFKSTFVYTQVTLARFYYALQDTAKKLMRRGATRKDSLP